MDSEVCQELYGGDPVNYRKCEARLKAVSKAEVDWYVVCMKREGERLKRAAATRGITLDEVPDDIILGMYASCEVRNPHRNERVGKP